MTNPEKNHRESQDQNYVYNKNGHRVFAKGNQIGRMKKRGYTILDLTKVAMQYDKTHDETILKHYIEQLLKDNRLLENFINKYVPTKTISELTGASGEPLNFNFIIERTYENEGDKDKINPQTD